jgi:hypothetical protein
MFRDRSPPITQMATHVCPRTGRFSHAAAAAAVALLLLSPSCSAPRGYAVLASFPHKDEIELTIFIERSSIEPGADVDTYRRIARAEVDRFRSFRIETPRPLYRFQIEFRESTHPFRKLAGMSVPLDGSPHAAAHPEEETWKVVLY